MTTSEIKPKKSEGESAIQPDTSAVEALAAAISEARAETAKAVELPQQTAHATSSKFYFPWMKSRNFDMFWYFCPLLVAAAATWLLQYPAIAAGLMFVLISNAFGVGPAHQGPTWFFYFDKKNREYWSADRKRVFFYYVAPVLVFGVSMGLAVFVPALSIFVTTLWGIQHFVQQNFGMTLLYHNKNGNEAMPSRDLLLRSLWAPAILFSSMFFYHLIVPGPMNPWAMGVFAALSGVSLYYVARYLLDIGKQVNAGARVNVPAFMFWLVSVLYFVPFIFPGQKFETVWLIPGTMHWFQYIGLNLILVKEKYKGEERKNDIPCGAFALMAVLCVGSLGIFLLTHGTRLEFSTESVVFRVMLGVYFGLANIHYYQDAFFWRFREKFQRESIMPYLMQARNPAQ